MDDTRLQKIKDEGFYKYTETQRIERETLTDDQLRELGWKQCTVCLEMRPPTLYYKSKSRNGLSYSCKLCHRMTIRGYRTVVDSYNFWYRRLEKLRKNARKRGLEFTLTVEDLREIKSMDVCYYCDTPTDIITLDRKDNALGYTVQNVVPSCFYCNRLKSDMFDEYEMKIIGKAIRHKHLRDKVKNDAYLKEVV